METTALLGVLLKGNGQIPDARVVSVVSMSNVVPPGENHLSQVTRVAVETESTDGKKRAVRQFILKDLPAGPLTRAYVERDGYFVRELTVYRDILTIYEDLIEELGSDHEILWPRCINIEPYSRIIIEDLQPLGYKMVSKFDGIDIDHCVLAMKALGLFHALSLLAVERRLINLEVFSGTYAYDSDILAREFHVALSKLADVLESWGYEWDLTAGVIRSLIPEVREKLKRILAQNENRFNVLNHGDFWTNNLLFKYDPCTGKLEKIRFLDFQMAHYHSPALDLVHFLAFCPNLNVRHRHVDHLIQVYHRSLSLNMDKLRVKSPIPKLNDIHDEVNGLGLLKLCIVLMVAPKLFAKEPNAEPYIMEEFLEGRAGGARGARGAIELPWLNFGNERFRAILEATLREAMKNGSLK